MPKRYQVVPTQDTTSALDSRDLARFLAKDGQLSLLPMLDLIENADCAVGDLISVVARFSRHRRISVGSKGTRCRFPSPMPGTTTAAAAS